MDNWTRSWTSGTSRSRPVPYQHRSGGRLASEYPVERNDAIRRESKAAVHVSIVGFEGKSGPEAAPVGGTMMKVKKNSMGDRVSTPHPLPPLPRKRGEGKKTRRIVGEGVGAHRDAPSGHDASCPYPPRVGG